ncbi:MAG: hypothetical protein Q4A41_06400 [Bacillota bacterium]|nr:hypothetical protein [Bacillota bacterium]
MKQTTRLRLNKPDYEDFADVEKLNENFDLLDAAVQKKNTRQVLTITTSDWLPYSAPNEDWTKKKEIAIEGITADDVPQLNFTRDCKAAATDAGVTQVETENGKLVLYAESVPSKTLTAELLLHKA